MISRRVAHLLSAAILLGACETTLDGTGGAEQASELATGAPQDATDRIDDTLQLPATGAAPVATPAGGPFVALLVPLSGSQAEIGRNLLDAAQLALFEIAGDDFELRPYDTQGAAQGARAAANAALNDGAGLIIGPLTAGSTRAAMFSARRRGVSILSFSNDRSVAGGGVYAMGFLPQTQVDRIVGYARAQGLNQFAALTPDNAYGQAMVAALEQAADDPLSSVVAVTSYQPGDESLPDVIRVFADYDERRQALLDQRTVLEARDDAISQQALERLKNRETLGEVPFEAVLLPAGSDEALQLAPLLAFYDVDPVRVRLLGTWLWDDVKLGNEPSMIGAWFAAPPPSARRDFEARFEDQYGRAPDRLATLAYDAVALAAILNANASSGDPYSIEALTAPNGFAGVDGIFRLLPSGEVQRGLAVLEIERGGFKEIDPTPASFEAIVN